MTDIVRTRRLSVQYPYEDHPVLQDISGTMHQGERILLLGASGSGKSSLCLCLNGLIPHSIEADVHGSVQVFGIDTAHSTPAHLAQHVGMVFQDPESQFCTLTVEDELAFGLENLRLSRAEIDKRIDQALYEVGLEGARSLRLDRLSGGMKQRVVLAAALAMDPKLLVLDEVTSNLDPAGTLQVVDLMAQLAQTRQERSFLIVEHHLDALIHFIDRVWVLGQEGRLLYDAAPRTLFAHHGRELEIAGIWQPLAMALAHHLQQNQITFDPYPLTMDEALCQLHGCSQAWPLVAEWAQPGADPEPEPGPPLVEMQDICFAYPDGTYALRDVHLRVRRGEVLALVGANGAGKTTLAQIMAGLLKPKQGTVRIWGEDISGVPLRTLARRCGFVFQNPEHQFVTDRVYDEVAFGLRQRLFGKRTGAAQLSLDEDAVHARTEVMLRRLDLWAKRNANPFELSQGQKRRLSVATMLVSDKALLVLDEPTFGQDVRNRRELVAELRRLNREGMTLVLVTHDMDLVWALAQRVAVLADGRLLEVGPVPAVFDNFQLLRRAHLERPLRADVAAAVQRWQSGEIKCQA